MAKIPASKSTTATAATTIGNGGETHQQGGGLTTNHGVPISDNQNSLKAGARGPVVSQSDRSAAMTAATRSGSASATARPGTSSAMIAWLLTAESSSVKPGKSKNRQQP